MTRLSLHTSSNGMTWELTLEVSGRAFTASAGERVWRTTSADICVDLERAVVEASRIASGLGLVRVDSSDPQYIEWRLPVQGPWCYRCGDAFFDPERPCPNPKLGKPYVDCGRGGHMFTLTERPASKHPGNPDKK